MPPEHLTAQLKARIQALEKELAQTRKTFQTLSKQEQKYRVIAENAILGIFVAQEGQIRYANLSTLTNVGYTRDELSAKPFIGFIHPDDREMVSKRHFKRLQGESLPSRYAIRILEKTGQVRWAELNVIQIQWDGLPATLNFMTDITQRKQAEDALRASEIKFRQMVEKSSMGIAIIDDQATVTYANTALSEMLGYEKDEIEGNDFSLFLWDTSREKAVAFYRKRQKGESVPDRYGVSLKNKSGEIRYGEVQSNVFADSRGTPNTIVQITDITDQLASEENRKQLENQLRQAQKMESVGRLAGGVAHDFNNMLNVILGRAELAMLGLAPDHPIQADLAEIEQACRRSAALTQQLLAFARKQAIAPMVLDLNDKVGGTLKMLQRMIGEDKELIWIPGHDLWPIRMDPAQIDQILANLAVNAHDAITGVGKVVVETRNIILDADYCTGHAGFVPGAYAMLSVSDNGCGMEKDTLRHLFEPFFTTKEVGKGTGLGLATIYGIVKQNRGFINVYSEPGEGAIFKIYLPRFVTAGEEAAKLSIVKPAVGGHETILLVEDEPAILSIGKSMLEKLGYTVLIAGSPNEAIELAKDTEQKIDLLITDVVMPEMNGKALAEKLKTVCSGIRCLYMSGYSANVIAHRGVLDESVDFIQKPFSSVELDRKIRGALTHEKEHTD